MNKIKNCLTNIFGRVTWWSWSNLNDDDWLKKERIKEVGTDYFSYILKWVFIQSVWHKWFEWEEISFVHKWTSTYLYFQTNDNVYFLTLRSNGKDGTYKDKGKWCFDICKQRNDHCCCCG